MDSEHLLYSVLHRLGISLGTSTTGHNKRAPPLKQGLRRLVEGNNIESAENVPNCIRQLKLLLPAAQYMLKVFLCM